jgi:hypothetical protein
MSKLQNQEAFKSRTRQPRFAIVETNVELGKLYARALTMYGFGTCSFSKSASQHLMKEDLYERSQLEMNNGPPAADTFPKPEKKGAKTEEVDFILFGHHIGESVQETMIRAKKISRHHRKARVIILSSDSSVREIAERQGFGFLEKPFTIRELEEFLST